jgi:D-alanyl-D-alanine carboxypeptidase
MMTRRHILVGPVAVLAMHPIRVLAGAPDAGVAALLAETGAPGAGMAVFRDGALNQAVGGLRALGQGSPVALDDLWHIGSNTKAMTATLVARLVEAGVIAWDDTVGGVLGGAIEGIDPAYSDATYGDLLCHRAGLPPNIGMWASLGLVGTLADRDMMLDRAEYARLVLNATPEGAPGTYHYSNAGYVVAGHMLQVATGQIWEQLIRAYVFDPLKMASAGFGAPGTPEVLDQPRGHKRGLLGGLSAVEPGPQADNIPAMGPAGTVHITMADMMRFLGAHAAQDTAFLAKENWNRLHTPPVGGDYAMGWRVTAAGHLVHNGSNTMWFARMQIDRVVGNAVFLVVNAGDTDAVRDVMTRLAEDALAG